MKVEFIEPFIRAAFSVLETIIEERAERGSLSMRGSTFTTQTITIMAGVNGDVEGTALYGMSLVTAQKIASAMMCEDLPAMNKMAWSAVSELGNMITGNATKLLYEAGYKCNITPPSVIEGMNVQISTRVPTLVVPVATKLGRLEINVALAEAVGRAKAA